MIPVTISADAFMQIDVDAFAQWCKDIGVDDQDWKFKEGGSMCGMTPETFMFRHEEHALMFRLKYGA